MHTIESSIYTRIHVFDIFLSLLLFVLPTDTPITHVTHNELFITLDTHNYNLHPHISLQIYRESAYQKPDTQIFSAQQNYSSKLCFLLIVFFLYFCKLKKEDRQTHRQTILSQTQTDRQTDR